MLYGLGYMRRGLTFIDVIISVAILSLLFGGIYLIYFSILDVVTGLDFRSAATSALNRQLELIRNLPYDKVGIVGGVPAGVIPSEQTITVGDLAFTIKALIRNIDDPFDGVLGGSPNDTAPADYKLVQLEVSCSACARFVPLILTGTVAPKGLESASNNGSLFINAIDANGFALAQVDVRVVNASVTPAIDLTDATNLSGVLQLVGVPTSTQNYQITVSKAGYSSEKTYAVGGAANPNPVKPHSTVAPQTVTNITFSIDRLSDLNVSTLDLICAPTGNKNFSLSGAKLIGATPNVLKFSTSSTTNASGVKAFSNIEWDTYSLVLNEVSFDLLGAIPFTPIAVNPSSTTDFKFIIKPAEPRSLLVTMKNSSNGQPIPGAVTMLTKSGFSETLVAGRNYLKFTDWSSGGYSSQSGGIEADSPMGVLKLKLNAFATYTTSTASWLESNTIDFGSASSSFYSIAWNPDSQSPLAGSDSLKFQLATNNDQSTWSYLGPDGTSGTYYVQSSSTIHSSHNSKRYMRYKVFMKTDDENTTPELYDLRIDFSGTCVPSSQTLFNNLTLADYTLQVSASGFQTVTSSVSIIGNWQQVEVEMAP